MHLKHNQITKSIIHLPNKQKHSLQVKITHNKTGGTNVF